MRMSLDAEGHHLDVTLTFQSQSAFTAAVQSKDWGDGSIPDGKANGNDLTGTLHLHGHTASIHADIDGKSVKGTISAFFLTRHFTGVITA